MKPHRAIAHGCVAAMTAMACLAACTLDTESLQPTALAGQECPAGQYMAGVKLDGQIVCRNTIDGFSGGAVSGNSSFDRVGIGTGSPTEALHVRDGNVRFQGVGSEVSLERNSNNPAAHTLTFKKTRGTSTVQAMVESGDLLGNLQWLGYDGADFMVAAYVQGYVDGMPALGRVPGGLKFVVTRADTGQPVSVMYITNAGAVGIGTSEPHALLEVSGGLIITPSGNDTSGLVCNNDHRGELRVVGAGGNDHLYACLYVSAAPTWVLIK